METNEFSFKGFKMNGFVMLLLSLLMLALSVVSFVMIAQSATPALFIVCGIVFVLCFIFTLPGFFSLEPNVGITMIFFGKYKGTFKETGFFWVNPFMSKKRLSLRARNLDVDPIKVNDKIGNPILIGLVLVWKLKDTYRAMFEIDAQTMAGTGSSNTSSQSGNVSIATDRVGARMRAFEKFVRIQSDAALRQVAGQYAYDNNDSSNDELTLRSGGDEINEQLEQKLNERLAMAGIEVIEARLNYLAYAPEIAAVMLRRQQASAIITAREKIVEGAVSMVKMALDKLKDDDVVDLDEDKKSAMVSNLLVVLCADEAAQPVLNTGTLNH
jgi:regulator of protease activity HflC (stomatin/prohibitin superfamily)